MPHARCSRCEARRTLARFPAEYVRPPRCRRCGSTKYRLDNYRRTVERGARARLCDPVRTGCGGYHFVHRHGSGFCIFNAKLTIAQRADREGYRLEPEFEACPF